MTIRYTVQQGDTLTKIAQRHHVTAQAIAELNALSSMNPIHIGQYLHIPAAPASESAPATAEYEQSPLDYSLLIQFVDVLNNPIQDLKVLLHADGESAEHLTNSQGEVPVLAVKSASSKVKVEVETFTGRIKHIATVSPRGANTYVRLHSPKLAVQSQLRTHEGKPPAPAAPTPATAKPPGTVVNTRSAAGHPVQEVTLECPNKLNLRLIQNFIYHDYIVAAANRAGMVPQAIAAIMNAEAATIGTTKEEPQKDKKTGKPLLDKTGKPVVKRWRIDTGVWDPKSASPTSSARGMTQFLDGTWIDMALTNGTFLNDRAKKEGWVTTTTVTIKHRHGEESKEVPAFKLDNGAFVTAGEDFSIAKKLSSKPYLTKWATASDRNLQTLLDFRFDAEYAIHTAVDYVMQNFAMLRRHKFKIDTINDGEKAKIAYLAHHLGPTDVVRFINDTMVAKHAEELLKNQINDAKAAEKAKPKGNDYLLAHRDWLNDFINDRIDLVKYTCKAEDALPVRELLPITIAIRATP